MKDFGASEPPKSTRSSTTHWCPGRPGHPAFRHNIASSLRLHTGLPYDWTPRSDALLGSPLAPSLRSPWRAADGPAFAQGIRDAPGKVFLEPGLWHCLHGWGAPGDGSGIYPESGTSRRTRDSFKELSRGMRGDFVKSAWSFPKMTLFGKVARLRPRRNKAHEQHRRAAPTIVFGKV